MHARFITSCTMCSERVRVSSNCRSARGSVRQLLFAVAFVAVWPLFGFRTLESITHAASEEQGCEVEPRLWRAHSIAMHKQIDRKGSGGVRCREYCSMFFDFHDFWVSPIGSLDIISRARNCCLGNLYGKDWVRLSVVLEEFAQICD